MDEFERSKSRFAEGYNCAQAVLLAFAEEIGLDPDTAARLTSAFGGGIARSGRVCGAVSGGLMVLGLRYGNTSPTDRGAKEATYALARRYMEDFARQHGSVDCPGLLGLDIGTPEGMKEARERKLFTNQCPVYVSGAVQLLLNLKENAGSD